MNPHRIYHSKQKFKKNKNNKKQNTAVEQTQVRKPHQGMKFFLIIGYLTEICVYVCIHTLYLHIILCVHIYMSIFYILYFISVQAISSDDPCTKRASSCCTAWLESSVTKHRRCDIVAGEYSTGPWDTFCMISMKRYSNISTSKYSLLF